MTNPQDHESNDLAGLFGEESSNDLGSLFGEEAPQGVSAQDQDLDTLFPTPSADADDLEALFNEPSGVSGSPDQSDLGDLFGDFPVAPGASEDLSDIFGVTDLGSHEADRESESSDLGSMFEDSPAEPSAEEDLAGLFGGESASEEAPKAPKEAARKDLDDAPEPEPKRKRPAPVFGELSRPTRTLELKGKPIVARSASKRAAETKAAVEAKGAAVEKEVKPAFPSVDKVNQALEATKTTNSQEVKEEQSVSSVLETKASSDAPSAAKDEAPLSLGASSLQALTNPPPASTPPLKDVKISAPVGDLPAPVETSKPETLSSVNPEPASEPVSIAPSEVPQEPSSAHAEDASADIEIQPAKVEETDAMTIPAATATGSEPQRAPVESAAEHYEREQRMRAHAEMERQTHRYLQTARYWAVVDRVLGVLSTEPSIQGTIKDFVLTRDKKVDSVQANLLREQMRPILSARGVSMGGPQDSNFVFEMIYDEVIGISVLGPLWRDDNVTEILVDSWDSVSVESNGVLMGTPLQFQSSEHANSVARSLAERISDRAVSKSNPLVTAELPRARIQFAYGPVVKGGLSLTIRKFQPLLTFDKLLSFGSLSPDMARFLQLCVQAKANILVSGGTNTGKTTIVNLLSGFIPDNERVVTIEDAFELKLLNRHWVALQTKEKASADDAVSVKLEDLLRATLRMRPDRVVVGEIRETAGAEVMVMAANTGHEGTMTTIHANDGDSAVNQRLPVLLRQNSSDVVARETVASAFQLVVQVSRRKGRRFISEISVIDSSCLVNGRIAPETIYQGKVDNDGAIFFRRDKNLRPGTDLYNKLVDEGLDISEWEN